MLFMCHYHLGGLCDLLVNFVNDFRLLCCFPPGLLQVLSYFNPQFLCIFSHTREISMFVPESSSAFQKFTG